jgi:hypothetical protein
VLDKPYRNEKTVFNPGIFTLRWRTYRPRAGDLYLNFSSDGYFIEDWEDIITQTFSLGILSDGCIIVPVLRVHPGRF